MGERLKIWPNGSDVQITNLRGGTRWEHFLKLRSAKINPVGARERFGSQTQTVQQAQEFVRVPKNAGKLI